MVLRIVRPRLQNIARSPAQERRYVDDFAKRILHALACRTPPRASATGTSSAPFQRRRPRREICPRSANRALISPRWPRREPAVKITVLRIGSSRSELFAFRAGDEVVHG